MSELNEFRQFLLGLLTEARELDKSATGKVRYILDAQIRLLERQIVFISKSIQEGTLDMEKAKAEIKVLDEGIVEKFGRASREKGQTTIKIIELANELKPGRYVKIDPRGMDRKSLEQKIYNLRGRNIPMDVKPKRKVNGEEGLFLVKLTKEQMSAEPKRSKRKEI